MAEYQPTLRVTNLLLEDNEDVIEKMFSRFGQVKAIIIDWKFSCAYVTFKDFNSAAKAIESQSSLRVKISILDGKQKTNKHINCFPIQNLNDDCLLHIISFLSLQDKLNLSEISKHFLNLCGKSFRITNKPFINCVDELLIMDGFFCASEKEFDMRILKFIPALCENLKVLSLTSHQFNKHEFFPFDEIKQIISSSQNLESVSITRINLNDNILDEMSKLRNLKILSLYDVEYDFGKNLNRLVNLTELNCLASIKSEHYISLFKAVKLERLILLYANLSISAFDALLEFQTSLQKLVIDTKYNCEYLKKLPNLPNLKELYLTRRGGVNVSLLNDIFFNQSRNKDLKIFISGILSENRKFRVMMLENNIYEDFLGKKGRKFQVYTNKCNAAMRCEWPFFPYDFHEVINITEE